MIRRIHDNEGPTTKRWTREEYDRLVDLGIFLNERVELLAGEIVEMTPQRGEHSIAIGLVERSLRAVWGDTHWIRVQMPLALGKSSEPEPDAAVVAGSPRDYRDHPTTALLIVEVSDTTLAYDSARKASLYASAGIREYWIVDLTIGELVVHRKPVADPDAEFGARYAELRRLATGDTIAPLDRPGARISVTDLLP